MTEAPRLEPARPSLKSAQPLRFISESLPTAKNNTAVIELDDAGGDGAGGDGAGLRARLRAGGPRSERSRRKGETEQGETEQGRRRDASRASRRVPDDSAGGAGALCRVGLRSGAGIFRRPVGPSEKRISPAHTAGFSLGDNHPTPSCVGKSALSAMAAKVPEVPRPIGFVLASRSMSFRRPLRTASATFKRDLREGEQSGAPQGPGLFFYTLLSPRFVGRALSPRRRDRALAPRFAELTRPL